MESIDIIEKSSVSPNQVSVDFMLGLPNQTLPSFMNNIDRGIKLGYKHMSIYDLTLEEKTPFYTKYKYDMKPLPKEEEIIEMYKYAH
jgi:oxygen-independent coproporphyrinogen-3 oxidase